MLSTVIVKTDCKTDGSFFTALFCISTFNEWKSCIISYTVSRVRAQFNFLTAEKNNNKMSNIDNKQLNWSNFYFLAPRIVLLRRKISENLYHSFLPMITFALWFVFLPLCLIELYLLSFFGIPSILSWTWFPLLFSSLDFSSSCNFSLTLSLR